MLLFILFFYILKMCFFNVKNNIIQTSVSSNIISVIIMPLHYYARIVTVPHDTLTSASCIYDSVGMLVAIIIMCVG